MKLSFVFSNLLLSSVTLVTTSLIVGVSSANAAGISFTPLVNGIPKNLENLDIDPINDIRAGSNRQSVVTEVVSFDIDLDTNAVTGVGNSTELDLVYELSFDFNELAPNTVNVNQTPFDSSTFQALGIEDGMPIVGSQSVSSSGIMSPLTVTHTGVPLNSSGVIDTWSFDTLNTFNDGLSDFSLSLISAMAVSDSDDPIDVTDQFMQLEDPEVEVQPRFLRFAFCGFFGEEGDFDNAVLPESFAVFDLDNAYDDNGDPDAANNFGLYDAEILSVREGELVTYDFSDLQSVGQGVSIPDPDIPVEDADFDGEDSVYWRFFDIPEPSKENNFNLVFPLDDFLDIEDMMQVVINNNSDIRSMEMEDPDTGETVRVIIVSGKEKDIATIPEPFTILGAGTAAGFGVFFKRKVSQKKDSNK